MSIDFRSHDQHENGLTREPRLQSLLEQRLQQPVLDLQFAQHIREKMRAQGLRVPLTEAETFAEADRRMRGGL